VSINFEEDPMDLDIGKELQTMIKGMQEIRGYL